MERRFTLARSLVLAPDGAATILVKTGARPECVRGIHNAWSCFVLKLCARGVKPLLQEGNP